MQPFLSPLGISTETNVTKDSSVLSKDRFFDDGDSDFLGSDWD